MSSIEKSQSDKRSYRHLKLSNKLEVTLIHDEHTEKSAACMDVRVGSMNDPEHAQGLAHFLEHMLFMGTEKYPVENAYSAFLSAHGGFSNAYTAQQDTVYYFDVQPGSFEEALDMFSSFFTCPLFNADSTSREITAVDNENTKNLQSDNWRGYQLLKSLAMPSHPFSYFSTGNNETLRLNPERDGIDMRSLLLEFYAKHYSANIMKLVVYGKESLDTLQDWVESKFSLVPNKDIEVTSFPEKAYEKLGKYVQVVPVRDVKNVDIYITTPPLEPFYLRKPGRYVSHLVGHESEGSILSALKARGWANGLSAYDYQSIKEFGWMCISVELTESGFEHVDEVIGCVFSYINMLKKEGPKQWIADEVKNIADLNFRFINQTQPSDYVTKIANNMQLFPVEHTITGSELIFEAETDLVPMLLSHLRIENAIIMIKNKSFTGKTTSQERWYGTEYNLSESFTEEQVALWKTSRWDDLKLPDLNPFIPTNFDIRADKVNDSALKPTFIHKNSVQGDDDDLYSKVVEAEGGPAESSSSEATQAEEGVAETEIAALKPLNGTGLIAWHMLDKTWAVPKANVMIKLESMMASCTAGNVALTELVAAVLKDVMNEYSYYADCAGLHYDVTLAKSGLNLSFFGYQDKLPVLILKTLDRLKNLSAHCDESLFSRKKEKLMQDYSNYLFWQPYSHCIHNTAICLEEPRWSSAEKRASLSTIELGDFQSYARQIVTLLKVEVFVHGNSTAEEALQISTSIHNTLGSQPLPFAMEPIRRVVAIEPGYSYVYRTHCKNCNPAEKNSAIQNLYLVTDEESSNDIKSADDKPGALASEAMLDLVAHLLSEPAFDQLRTKEQLGYIVHTSKTDVGHLLGLRIIVQSNSKDGHYLDGRIESFLEQYRTTLLADMTLEELNTNIRATIEKLIEKPKNLDEETGALWDEIRKTMYLFDRKALKADYLRGVLKANKECKDVSDCNFLKDIKSFYDIHLRATSDCRRKFSAQFYGQGTKYPSKESILPPKTVLIEEPGHFKRDMQLLKIKTASV